MGSWGPLQPSEFYGKGDNYPVYYRSWDDCQDFVNTLNEYIIDTEQGPATFRLPSEAEWEYACRAGTSTTFYFGDSDGCDPSCEDCAAGTLPGNRSDYMWYCGNNGSAGTSEYGTKLVAQLIPNNFGLYNMHGNVREWCQDYLHNSYDLDNDGIIDAPTDGSAWEFPATSERAIRGGSWYVKAGYCRSSSRYNSPPYACYDTTGFRIVWTP